MGQRLAMKDFLFSFSVVGALLCIFEENSFVSNISYFFLFYSEVFYGRLGTYFSNFIGRFVMPPCSPLPSLVLLLNVPARAQLRLMMMRRESSNLIFYQCFLYDIPLYLCVCERVLFFSDLIFFIHFLFFIIFPVAEQSKQFFSIHVVMFFFSVAVKIDAIMSFLFKVDYREKHSQNLDAGTTGWIDRCTRVLLHSSGHHHCQPLHIS